MLNQLTIRKFKRFSEVKIELGNPVVFIGPNNSGKTSALQALALWEAGLNRWSEKRKGKTVPVKRVGVTLNRKELVTVPVPSANLLWRDLHVRDVQVINGKQDTKNVRIEIVVEGISEDASWQCGLEFDYANDESFYCRPLRLNGNGKSLRMDIPEQATSVRIAYLPPMSGLAANEVRLDSGAVNVRIGEGRTAEVVRNLCHSIAGYPDRWAQLRNYIAMLFGINLDQPQYIAERGEIAMTYRERDNTLDLSSCGRGLHQTLLLLAYMYNNPGAVLLLDEPDAHLEILRQRQIYQVLTDVAGENGNQLIVASHSEVLLNEAADRDVVVAFVGNTPHRINDKKGSQVRKSLQSIGFEKYYQAEQTGWILFLEGSSDLAILRAFAKRLKHTEARQVLERPFIDYVENKTPLACDIFNGLREAVPDLKGIALFDRLDQELPPGFDNCRLTGMTWSRREIENYFCYPETLLAYADQSGRKESAGDLFSVHESDKRLRAMKESIEEVTQAMRTLKKGAPWDTNSKVSDDFLDPLFETYFNKLNLPNLMAKKNFHELVPYVPEDKIDTEVREKLDTIVKVARSAKSSSV